MASPVAPQPLRRVLVVDDHAAVRVALVALINSAGPTLVCVGAATSVFDMLQMATETQPHIVVLDADLAGEDGVALIPALLTRARCRVVVLSSHADACLTAYALRLGAAACIHKMAPAEDLLIALDTPSHVTSVTH